MIILNPQNKGVAIAVGFAMTGFWAGIAAAQEPNITELVARADANEDGDISWSEVTALRLESFQRADRNDDGVVNTDDRPPRLFAGQFDQALARLQADFDGNQDGEITEEEMLNAPAPMFDSGDVDGDGILTADEMATLRAQASAR